MLCLSWILFSTPYRDKQKDDYRICCCNNNLASSSTDYWQRGLQCRALMAWKLVVLHTCLDGQQNLEPLPQRPEALSPLSSACCRDIEALEETRWHVSVTCFLSFICCAELLLYQEKKIRLKAKKKNRLLGWQRFKTTHSLSAWSWERESQHKFRQQSQGERWGRLGCVAAWPRCAVRLAGEPASAASGDASSSEDHAQLLLHKT